MNVVSMRERPDLRGRAKACFGRAWAERDEAYLLIDGEAVAGRAMLSESDSGESGRRALLREAHVEPDYRGRACEALLLDRVRADAASRGFGRLYLRADEADEAFAAAFQPSADGLLEVEIKAANPRVCLYAGSFDPPTLGHIDLIERAARLFERVIVAVMQNPAKKGLFTPEERVKLLEKCLKGQTNVDVLCDGGLTVDVAKRVGAGVLLRGVRGESDVDLESTLAAGNRMLASIDTLVMFTDPKYGFISSSVVKDVLKHGGPIEGMTPEAIVADVYARRGR